MPKFQRLFEIQNKKTKPNYSQYTDMDCGWKCHTTQRAREIAKKDSSCKETRSPIYLQSGRVYQFCNVQMCTNTKFFGALHFIIETFIYWNTLKCLITWKTKIIRLL